MEHRRAMLKESIQFVNDLATGVESSEDLRYFYELVKSRQCKDINDAEFYELAYEFLRGDFALLKKLGNALKDGMTPSYIKLPTTFSAGGDDQVLNNSCSIYGEKVCGDAQRSDPYYIYRPFKVIDESRFMPCMDGMTSEEKKREAVAWWESRRSELDVLVIMLKRARKVVKKVLKKIELGEWAENAKLRDYLVKKGVKVKLLEKLFWDFEILMLKPTKSLPVVVKQIRREKEKVVEAIGELNQMRKKDKLFVDA